MTDAQVREQVRAHYAQAATAVLAATGRTALPIVDAQCCTPAAAGDEVATCCGGDAEVGAVFGPDLYSAAEHGELPAAAVAASLGCGNPMLVAELREGERVLDLGSGGGGFNAKPAGVYVVKDGRVTWQPALDVNRIVMGGQLVAIVVALTLRAIFKRH